MRSYLERVAAAAITPGGTFHPMAGSLYARPSDSPASSSNAFPEAEPLHPIQTGISADTQPEAPFFDPKRTTSFDVEASQPHSPFLSVVQPSAAPHTLPSARQAIPLPSLPSEPSSGQDTPQAAFSPLISPAIFPSRVSPTQTQDQAFDQTKAQPQPSKASQPAHPERTSTSAPSSPSYNAQRSPLFQPAASAASPKRRASSRPYEAQPSAPSQPAASPASLIPGTASPEQRTSQPPVPSSNLIPAPATPAAASHAATPFVQPSSPTAPSPQQASPYQPLVAGYTAPSPRSPAAIQPRQQNPRLAAPSPLPEQREPDEIQIHIGRIEVTAVAPAPAPRPQPTAIRKTPSLDDYLRRGNGRA